VVDATPNALVKVMADDVTPAQSVCALTASTVGVGLTETITSFVALHPFDVMVYWYVTLIAAFVVFVKVSLMSPDPDVPACVIPAIVALVQLIVVLPLDATVALVAVYAKVVPLHIAAGVNVLDNAGVGLTVMVAVNGDP